MIKAYNRSIFFSVIIATFNRCESLRSTLDSFLTQELCASFDYEIIIVDNNSKDETKKVFESYSLRFNSKLKYIFEPCQGKSHALNTGIKEARGEIIALTDDDCIMDKRWLYSLYVAFRDYGASCVGGKILPIWPSQRPTWLGDHILSKLAILDYGDNPFQITSRQKALYGANLAIKKDKLSKQNPFNINLGRKGYKLYGGEDEKIFQDMLDAGEKIFYQPEAIVFHKIPLDRVKKNYFRKYNFDSYRSLIRFDENSEKSLVKYFNIPRYLFKKFLKSFIFWLAGILSFQRSKNFENELKCWAVLGQMYEYYSNRKNV